jgi:hypothetical protein
MSLVGRPSSYDSRLDDKAYKLALLGCTDVEMADILGISEQTLNVWKHEHPEFSESIKRGKYDADANVADRLYQRAMGYSHPAVKIFMPSGAEEPVYADYTEHYPPDTQAASLWLRNRQPEKWRDKTERESTVKGNLTVNIEIQRAEAVAALDDIFGEVVSAKDSHGEEEQG